MTIPPPPAPTSPLLFAEDLARLYKMPRQRAHRWLQFLERKYGAVVVGQFPGSRGIRRYTTEAALESIGPAARSRWADLDERMELFTAELQRLAREVEETKERIR